MHIQNDVMNKKRVFVSIKKSKNKDRVDNWALVLSAMNISYQIKRWEDKWSIWVEPDYQDKALYEIQKFENEDQQQSPPEPQFSFIPINIHAFAVTPILLFLFFFVTGHYQNQIDWLAIGAETTEQVLAGEWWRAITSLTLHADISHLLGNLILGSIMAYNLCRLIGPGLGWFLILGSGFLGNILKVYLWASPYRSIGASTAVFGAIGILGALQLYGKYKQRQIHAWIPLGASFLLLAFLGFGGENTDISAHIFGFLAGIILGIVTSIILVKSKLLAKKYQSILAFLLLIFVLFCWALAFNIIAI